MLEVKAVVAAVRRWWTHVPGSKAGPGRCLEAALDVHTEVHPQHDSDFPRHLTRFLLRLALLRDVFLDRDYGDKDRRCVIPFAWERWTARLVARLAPFTQLAQLRVYGGLYPSILAAVLRGASRLASLQISHINITDDILLDIAKWCPNLHTLRLLHSFPWQVISMKAFCAAFFSGAMPCKVIGAYKTGRLQDIQQTFPQLKDVDLAYGGIRVASKFHKLLLNFYPELRSVSSPWKTIHIEDGYQYYGSEVLFSLLARERVLAIRSVFFDDVTLYTLRQERLEQLARCCPQVQAVTVDCVLVEPEHGCDEAGARLAQLTGHWKHMSELHVNVNTTTSRTKALLQPCLRVHGASLTALTVEADSPGLVLEATLLDILLQACPNLTCLGVRVWNRNMMEAQLDGQDRLPLPQCAALQKFSLHEQGPGDGDEAGHVARWLALVGGVVATAPGLATLSLCRGLACLLNTLACHATTLHLHVKDGHEWQPTAEELCRLVGRMPRLHHLYLEEVSGELFWRLRRRYRHTDMRLHWGNLHDWPRT